MRPWRLLALSVPFAAARTPDEAFADALVDCIHNHAREAANSVQIWGSACMPPTEKIDHQAAVYTRTLARIRDEYGYSGALWCAFYSVRMTGAEYDPNSDQPNNPNFADWYATLACPWNVTTCGYEPLGMHGNEWLGVPAEWGSNQNAQYKPMPDDDYVQDEPDRRTMSCGLCGHLHRALGPPPFQLDPPPMPKELSDLYTNNWDFHPFGAWLANEAAKESHADVLNTLELVSNIHKWKVTDRQELIISPHPSPTSPPSSPSAPTPHPHPRLSSPLTSHPHPKLHPSPHLHPHPNWKEGD